MCGICGYLAKDEALQEELLLHKMGKAILHRGPNDVGYFEEKPIGLCHRRLSILDLSSKGHQPMEYNTRYVLVFNGEIYNYLELRQELKEKGYSFDTNTDTEVILASYDCWGTKCLERFNGMWSFSLWDKQRKQLFCARDRFGVKPFYYNINKERFLFASEIKALLCDSNIERIANAPIVFDYLTQGLVEHTNETFFEGIYKLPAGYFMIVDSELNIHKECYYDITFSDETDGKLNVRDQNQCREILEDSVRLRLRADVPVGSCLSGGLDSSSIVCCMDELLKKEPRKTEQHTFSFCTEDKRIDERKYMEEVSKATDTIPHQVFADEEDLKCELEDLIYFQDEPFSSTGMYASYCVYREASKNGITVLLDGQGADEILCGYRKARIYYIKKLIKEKRIFSALAELLGAFSQIKGTMFLKNDLYKIKKILSKREVKINSDYLNKNFVKVEKGYDYSRQNDFQHNDVFVSSLPALLRYADRNSMAFSIESRLPFLDYRFVEFCASLPIGKKIHHGWSKYIMRNSLQMPDLIKKRKDKIGFATPEDSWLKNERDYFRSIFKEEKIWSEAFIDTNQLLKNWDSILDNNNGAGLFRYICLELWMRKFKVKSEDLGR
ncbi:asparagine synthase (glutamine-hydrolyzing) [Anaerostipes sp.]|uniref:asparagine synthase (glutamine-hydrolyzing) n=1 Tax=Anaerostipes sp. TaxID=1872530 RepID=UPI0025BA6813|nr:asparagine synthase (glutamine-hydrolyzing) [Anaerostipes sp.]MBS7007119.1 asparagine synthase (glutamine-hydrolyzing) [Anaerostipes sp.]